MAEEFKKYDSNCTMSSAGVRLAQDPRVNEYDGKKLVTLTYVSTSRREKNQDIWVNASVREFDADAAVFLKKGDVLHLVEGKPVMRPYGDGKVAFELERARIVIPLALRAELKERGFTPGGAQAKPTASSKFAKKAKPRKVEIDDDFED